MKIICQEHYDKVLKYAQEIGDITLESCLERLKRWENNSQNPCEMELYYDHAPYSFLFKQRYENGNYGVIGGLVYHGNPDQSGCFQIEPTKGWEIHT